WSGSGAAPRPAHPVTPAASKNRAPVPTNSQPRLLSVHSSGTTPVTTFVAAPASNCSSPATNVPRKVKRATREDFALAIPHHPRGLAQRTSVIRWSINPQVVIYECCDIEPASAFVSAGGTGPLDISLVSSASRCPLVAADA